MEWKWSIIFEICWGSAKETSIHSLTSCQRVPKIGQWRRRWYVDSLWPHLVTHNLESFEIMSHITKLSFLGHLLRRRRHTHTETFKGVLLCQIYADAASQLYISCRVSIWYTPRTVFPSPTLGHHNQTYVTLSCKETSASKVLHSSTNSSSHANTLRLHNHPSPSFSPP